MFSSNPKVGYANVRLNRFTGKVEDLLMFYISQVSPLFSKSSIFLMGEVALA